MGIHQDAGMYIIPMTENMVSTTKCGATLPGASILNPACRILFRSRLSVGETRMRSCCPC